MVLTPGELPLSGEYGSCKTVEALTFRSKPAQYLFLEGVPSSLESGGGSDVRVAEYQTLHLLKNQPSTSPHRSSKYVADRLKRSATRQIRDIEIDYLLNL